MPNARDSRDTVVTMLLAAGLIALTLTTAPISAAREPLVPATPRTTPTTPTTATTATTATTPATTSTATPTGPVSRVILVTLDGVRWHDVIGDERALDPNAHPTMPALLERVKTHGVLYEPKNATVRTSSLVPISLPGYMALMTGATTPCRNNKCARLTTETLPETIARRLALPPSQVAVFASWARIARAATSHDGGVHVDIPPEAIDDDGGPPWENARYDKVTIEHALTYLAREQPRFLWLSLLDTDERAHRGERDLTIAALHEADDALARIFAFVDALPEAERARTTVVVTTDHGRGDGAQWTDHGVDTPAAWDIWLAILRDRPSSPSLKRVTQADVKPLVLDALAAR